MIPRIVDPGLIEQRLLEFAYTSNAKITAPALAYFAPCSIEAAQKVLDKLSSEDRLQMEVEDDGTIVYQLPARTQLPPHAAPSASTHEPGPRALVPISRSLVPVERHASPAIAAVLAAVFPGAGHLYAGRIFAAFLWFFAISLGYLMFVPGLILHLASMVSAARAAALPAPYYHATT
jgi:hypothetical protein